MKGFLEEYGLIIVVVAVILLMLLFAKTGLAKNIQDAITNTVNHLLTEGNKAATTPTAGGGFILQFFEKKNSTTKACKGKTNIQMQISFIY